MVVAGVFLGGSIIKLFALPYAFGSSYCYNDLSSRLDKSIELIPMDYPGHGTRLTDPLLYDVGCIVNDMYRFINSKLAPYERYALLGYSMGGLVCYELARLLENEHAPEAVFILASHHPGYKYKTADFENYDLKDVMALLEEYGGTPTEALESEELLQIMKPVVCADMIALRDYINSGINYKFKCPVTFVGGTKEVYTEENKTEWRRFAMNDYEFFDIEGGHFFLFNNQENLNRTASIINSKLK